MKLGILRGLGCLSFIKAGYFMVRPLHFSRLTSSVSLRRALITCAHMMVGTLLVSVFAAPAWSVPVTFRFEGTVTRVDDPHGMVADRSLLQTIRGKYTFDSDTPAIIFPPPYRYSYFPSHAAPTYSEMEIGPARFFTHPNVIDMWVYQRDEQELGALDEYGFLSQYNATSGLATSLNVDSLQMSMRLQAIENNPIVGLSVLLTPPDLSLFSRRSWNIEGECLICTNGEMFSLSGEITSLTLETSSKTPGDLNADGTVNRGDVALLARQFGNANPVGAALLADLDGNGVIGLGDLARLQQQLDTGGSPSASPPTPIPEPSVVAIVVSALLSVGSLKARSRRR